MSDTLFSIAKSWAIKDSTLNSTADILAWVRKRNDTVEVSISKNRLEDSTFWFYSEQQGAIVNKNGVFFRIAGFVKKENSIVTEEQPILLQDEIGYLGILCKEFDGVMHFLMQAKIEPGNINKIQLSPTIQATKSNFTQKHGGARPPYLDYFIEAERHEIVVDQIQSEQSSRFLKKRNRNILVRVHEEVELLPSHRWMTLGQIKQLMREDNLVNMDTRTVLSCIPYALHHFTPVQLRELQSLFLNKALFRSVFEGSEHNLLPMLYRYINNFKMFDESSYEVCDLYALEHWQMRDGEFVSDKPAPFKVVFCDIAIEGREVKRWTQPLFEALGIATFGLMTCCIEEKMYFLVHARPESGCHDAIEIGPTIQVEPVELEQQMDAVSALFWERVKRREGILFDTLLSAEGGRFYHEQSRNVILTVSQDVLPESLPAGYFWVDYKTLNLLVQVNNTLNIQLRNLLSVLEA